MVGLISIEEFAKTYVHKKPETVRTWMRRGQLPEYLFKRTGGSVMVREHRIQEWIDSDD
jgi:hypothetical protein